MKQQQFTLEKGLIFIMIGAVLLVFIFMFYLLFSRTTKSIEIVSPIGGEEWEIGSTQKIQWESKGFDKVGIVLFQGEEPEWIAKNVPATAGEYEWKIYPGKEYNDNYWIAVFEYPWQKENVISYSRANFAITFPELFSCDNMSTENEWPYLPSDVPNLRRVFITDSTYKGDLGGLDGADSICQQEAVDMGFEGEWQAFIGGDAEDEVAVERIKNTKRGTNGIFVEAYPSATLIRDATCHRLIAKNFDEFLSRGSELSVVAKEKLSEYFFEELDNVWLGRVDYKSKKNCITIADVMSNMSQPVSEKYSFTSTCQNWTKSDRTVSGYPVPRGSTAPEFPTCYTPEGQFTSAVALGGLASGFTGGGENSNSFTLYQGKYCDEQQKLICIEK